MASGNITTYNRKRNFKVTTEPPGKSTGAKGAGSFVVQKHAASRLHYDFRLEWNGVLRSWAIPKGPSLDPAVKRMAVQVEDHPVSYRDFEGVIPKGNYGAGSVIVWDRGVWQPLGDAAKGLREGKLKFVLAGEKLQGGFTLVRLHGREKERQPPWLLIKEKDPYARPTAEFDVVEAMGDSVLTPPKGRGARSAAKASPVAGAATEDGAMVQSDPNADDADAGDVHAQGKGSVRGKAKGGVPGKAKGGTRGGAKASARGASKANARGKDTARAATAKAALPPLVTPQLATLVTAPPQTGEWDYELKLDGYRLLVRVDGDDVRCFTRNGNDWTSRMPRVAAAVSALKLPPCWLDGELVALNEKGVPDFQRLQNAFEHKSTSALQYIVFDLLFEDGEDLRALGQRERRARLQRLLKNARGTVQFSKTLEDEPQRLLKAARAAGFEGLLGKRADARYTSGRSRDWIKLKVGLRQEFVIGGFTDPQGSRAGLGSLLLGVHDETGALRYAGNVGSGFDQESLEEVHAKLSKIEQPKTPFTDGPAKVGTVRRVVPHWVKPKLVAEISFAGWTEGGHVRQGVFHGLREDKPPEQITIERAKQVASEDDVKPASKARPAAKRGAKAAPTRSAKKAPARQPTAGGDAPAMPPLPKSLSGLRITHPERVIDASAGITKGQLVAYYAAISELMLPHLAQRPVALLRAPEGVNGEKFFQKHAEARALPEVDRLPPRLDPEHKSMLAISSPAGLVSAAQMNVIELHTWNATTRAIEKPDRIIFDLDPGENVPWKSIVEAARLMRSMLEELELKSFLKTSGGKGLHVVVPVKPAMGWDESKQFSGDVVRHMARVLPQRFVAKSGPKNRVGRIFVDFLRNGRGATTVAAWSARARAGMGISVPLDWKELDTLRDAATWTVLNFAERLKIGNAPWRDYEKSRQGLRAAQALLKKVASD